MLVSELIVINCIIWGIPFLLFSIQYIFNIGEFRRKLQFFRKKLSVKKFLLLMSKGLGVIALLFLVSNKYDMKNVVLFITLFVSFMSLIFIGLLTNLNEKFSLEEVEKSELLKATRKSKLRKIKRKSLIYRIKNII